ncbi:GH22574 [Drosophila grimshawi]|uniref:GH22574 n=1 Tax=Drosophila grimshawi TaxID=7222 RepID=B4K286_DROGR|nr:GH22574 [Drosophila grimshawi]
MVVIETRLDPANSLDIDGYHGLALMNFVHSIKRLNILATGGATHYPYDKNKRPSALDFAVYGGLSNTCLRTYSSVDLDSDHLPVHIELAAKRLSVLAQAGLRRRILPSNANISKFQAYLN